MRGVPTLLLIGLLFVPSAASAQGDPLGPEFRINTYTTSFQGIPAVASDPSGNFVVVWQSFYSQDGSGFGIFGQRYASNGTPLGPEFRVNTFTTGWQAYPAVTSDSSGNFVVAWWSEGQESSNNTRGVFGQRYASTGAPLGPEFRVNTYTTNSQDFAAVASGTSGNFIVVWRSFTQDGSLDGIFGQRYANTGAPLGPEFRVNTYTTGNQRRPAVASDASGNFVVVWGSDQDGSGYGVIALSPSATPTPEHPSVPSSASTRTHRICSATRRSPRTPRATSSLSGQAATRTAPVTAFSASAMPAPERLSVPSSASIRTRRITSAIRP
jgi:hypothetical protein